MYSYQTSTVSKCISHLCSLCFGKFLAQTETATSISNGLQEMLKRLASLCCMQTKQLSVVVHIFLNFEVSGSLIVNGNRDPHIQLAGPTLYRTKFWQQDHIQNCSSHLTIFTLFERISTSQCSMLMNYYRLTNQKQHLTSYL